MSDTQLIKELQAKVILLEDKLGLLVEDMEILKKRADRQKQSLHELWHFFYVLKTGKK